MNSVFQKISALKKEFENLTLQIQDASLVKDQKKYSASMQRFSELEKIIDISNKLESVEKNIQSNKDLLSEEKDDELRSLAKEENLKLEEQKKLLETEIKYLLLPKDPNDDKNIILEVRAGAGGDEACLFAEELFRAYTLYAQNKKWLVELISRSEGNAGGVKEIIASLSGKQVFSLFKYESGVHRVQRVPKTESQGRVHTSTVTVAVLPEAESVDVNIQSNDLRIDTYRASGHGGQSVNTTDSAIRVTHLPTGLVVTCQDGKSQHSNKEQALKVLYSRLLQVEQEKAHKEESEKRKLLIGTGDRSERIRTYNFPQSRITDHRISLTVHSLTSFMEGGLQEVLDAAVVFYQTKRLQSSLAED